jgi:hypothetical protein
VLDPFAGTGTTLAAALASGRNGIGVEKDAALIPVIAAALARAPSMGDERSRQRMAAHRDLVESRTRAGRPPEHAHRRHGYPVVTSQEVDLELCRTTGVERRDAGVFVASHVYAKAPEQSEAPAAGLPSA